MKRIFKFTTEREVEEMRRAGKWVFQKDTPKETVKGCILYFSFFAVLGAIMWIQYARDPETGPWDFLGPLFATVVGFGCVLFVFAIVLTSHYGGCIVADEDGIELRSVLGKGRYLPWEKCKYIGFYTYHGRRSHSSGIMCSVIPLPPWAPSFPPDQFLPPKTTSHLVCDKNIYIDSFEKEDLEILIAFWQEKLQQIQGETNHATG